MAFLTSLDNKSSYYDILVLGDSFSFARPEAQWQNYLATATRESIGSLDINKVSLNQILASRGFLANPPKILIFEAVERMLPKQLKSNTESCQENQHRLLPFQSVVSQVVARIPNSEAHLTELTLHMDRGTGWKNINPGYGWQYLQHTFPHRDALSSVYAMELTRPAPFSSRNKSSILIFNHDVEKIKWWRDMGESEMGCRIEAIRDRIEANGYTRFVLMVPPDKLTAYADYLSDSKFKNVSLLSRLADIHQNVMPRLDKTLTEAIHEGEQDVYLPDDTRWGSNGQRIAAETLISFLAPAIP